MPARSTFWKDKQSEHRKNMAIIFTAVTTIFFSDERDFQTKLFCFEMYQNETRLQLTVHCNQMNETFPTYTLHMQLIQKLKINVLLD